MKKEIGYALGGGGAKTLPQLGAIEVLEKYGIKPTYYAGTSMGAVTAVLLAAGYSVQSVKNFYLRTSILKMFSLKLSKNGLITNKLLGELIENLCKRKGINSLEDFNTPVYIAATDAKTGNPVTIKSGSIKEAIMASTATIFCDHATLSDGREMKDGCYTRNVPFDLLDEIREDKCYSKNFYDIAFDAIPTPIQLLNPIMNKFNDDVYKNDQARKQKFLDDGKGCYLDLENSLGQQSFYKTAIELAYEQGEMAMLNRIDEVISATEDKNDIKDIINMQSYDVFSNYKVHDDSMEL